MTFDLTAISAILAVIGYSLNDTVIVFDRMRERARNARKLADRAGDRRIDQSDPVANLDDQARDLLVVVALLIFGGETLHGFSAALVIGIIAGTYSSIYISAALVARSGVAGGRSAGAQARPSRKRSTACPRSVIPRSLMDLLSIRRLGCHF